MNRLLFICFLLVCTATAFGQFTDTATLNQYIRDTLKDRRPEKISVAQLQKAFLGVTAFLQQGGATTDTLSRGDADQLRQDSLLVPGKFYFIMGVDESLYGGTDILLRALTPYQFSTDGLGNFYNPNYEEIEQGIWDGEVCEVSVYDKSGEFYPGEAIETTEGHVGFWLNNGHLSLLPDGEPWTMGTYNITGQQSGSTAEIVIFGVKAYAPDDKVIWGGRVWNNLTGNTGYQTGPFQLNEDDWEMLPYEPISLLVFIDPGDPGGGDDEISYYVKTTDPIKYDWDNDRILGRREEAGDNEVFSTFHFIYNNSGENPIKSFQWGNPYNTNDNRGIGSQRITNGVNQNINFNGEYQINIEISDSYQTDIHFNANSRQDGVKLERGSEQHHLYFFNSGQTNISLYSSTQSNASLSEASQVGFTFIRGSQQHFSLSSFSQENHNLWGYDWDRNYVFLEGGSDVGIYKFGPPPEDDSPDQVFLRTQMSDVFTIYQSSSVVSVSDLDFDVDANESYGFEYELYALNYINLYDILFSLSIPSAESVTAFYTFTNMNTGAITTHINTTGAGGALYVTTASEYYHIRISGFVIGTTEGTISLGVAPDGAPYGGEFGILTGSFAKFTKFPYYPPPME